MKQMKIWRFDGLPGQTSPRVRWDEYRIKLKILVQSETQFRSEFGGSLHCVVANVQDCGIIVSEFEL